MTPALEYLQSFNQWVCWRFETREGRQTKVPKNPHTGGNAQSDTPATWGSFTQAQTAQERYNFSGVGFMLNPQAVDLAGIDIDHCLDDTGQPSPFAREVIETVKSYTEITPSGKGLRIFALGKLPPTGRKHTTLKFEIYDQGRFLTVTGNHLAGTPVTVERRDTEILAIHRRVFGEVKPVTEPARQPITPNNLDDRQLLEIASNAQNGAKFQGLWAGHKNGYSDDDSAADLALCNLLAFWTGRDTDRIDRLFRQSGLYRDKWDKRHSADGRTYGQMTIDKALATVTEVYEPNKTNLLDVMPEKTYTGGATWAELDKLIGPIDWAWPGWLPKGLLSMIVAESGAGKSAMALRLAASYLRGDVWPDGSKFTGETGCILWAEAEAAQAVNLSRAKKWGLPIEQILSPLANPLDDIQLDNPEHQGALCSVAQQERVKFIIVDSLSGGTRKNSKEAAEMMTVVKMLAEIARNTGKPVLLTHHLRKKGLLDSGEKITLDRVRDSSAIVQPARVIWGLDTPDPIQEDNKRLSVIKSNIARFPNPIGLHINENGVTFGEAPRPPRKETLSDKASDLLLSILAKEPLPAAQVQEEIEQAGLSWFAAKRAKDKLGVVSIKTKTGWLWGLPERGPGDEISF